MIFENYDKILFIGDSVTDMGRLRPVGEGAFENLGSGYVRVVENLLSACYPELALHIVNMGISGNTARTLAARWQTDVKDLKPQWVSICIGINDVWRQFDWPSFKDEFVLIDEYESHLEKMLVDAKANCKGVFLMTPYYMEPNRSDCMRTKMDEYVSVCKKLAKKHEVTLVDLQSMFDEYFKYRHSSFIAWDRVHPNQIGATLIAKEFLSHCGFEYTHKVRKKKDEGTDKQA